MTPFGARIRSLREQRGLTLRDMAAEIGVSSAYLSALEHGKRGRPSWHLVQRIIAYFNVIWDEAEDLAKLARVSHPKISINTAGLDPEATELANLLSNNISKLDEATIQRLLKIVKDRP
jgi:transcriptional regulator with XRE-family HTH domain